MSRNLGQRCCKICDGDVVMDEPPRPATENDCGFYFSEYQPGFTVANSHCVVCDAKYLAWVELKGEIGHFKRHHGDDRLFVDLSFRSTFDDEPGPDDLPTKEVLARLEVQWREEAIDRKLQEISEYRIESQQKLLELYEELESAKTKTGDSYWESYRRRHGEAR